MTWSKDKLGNLITEKLFDLLTSVLTTKFTLIRKPCIFYKDLHLRKLLSSEHTGKKDQVKVFFSIKF
jgi:hypothetical protein